MFLLIYLKKIFQGSKFDICIRLIINYLSPHYYKFSKKINFTQDTKFIYICYGGLGDCILAFPFLINLSDKCKVTIFIDAKFKGIENLLNRKIEVKFYVKKDLFKELKNYRKINSNLILIQQSPILEFILFHFFLRMPPTIGFLYKQNQISCEGFLFQTKTINTKNKILKYDLLEKNIIIMCNQNNFIQTKKKYFNQLKFYKFSQIPEDPFFILSPTKDPNWSMGFLEYKVYANLIIKILQTTNLTPVLVGTHSDKQIIENILDNLPPKYYPINLVGKTTIKDLISLLNETEFVVANDNGIHHLSNFLNKKTLTLYNFSSYNAFNWHNKNSNYIFKPLYDCMPCVGKENGPFDNYPFKCPWNIRCKKTIDEIDIINKLKKLNWINLM